MGKEEFNATVSSDGKITIPKNTRILNNIDIYDIVLFKIITINKAKKIETNLKEKDKDKAPK